MGTTANYGWPYPAAGASNNPPADIQGVADAADATVKSIHDSVLGAIPPLDSTGSDITTTSPGDTGGAGTSGDGARADHKHPHTIPNLSGAPAASPGGNLTSNGTLLTIPLAVGTWIVSVSATAGYFGSSGLPEIQAAGAAGITLTGATTSACFISSTAQNGAMSLSFKAVVGTSGNVTITGTVPTGTEIAGAPFTGYTAFKVG